MIAPRSDEGWHWRLIMLRCFTVDEIATTGSMDLQAPSG
jgi:hypothetical protein